MILHNFINKVYYFIILWLFLLIGRTQNYLSHIEIYLLKLLIFITFSSSSGVDLGLYYETFGVIKFRRDDSGLPGGGSDGTFLYIDFVIFHDFFGDIFMHIEFLFGKVVEFSGIHGHRFEGFGKHLYKMCILYTFLLLFFFIFFIFIYNK